MLDIQVRHRLASFTLEAAFTVPSGAVTVLVGESGSGKTTLLRLVAGLLAPEEGHISLAGTVLSQPDAGRFIPPEARPVGYVAQDYALFPHLSARENVAFGLRARRLAGAVVRERTDSALERFGLASLATRRPHQLSGGEQQRVALARALVLDPRVLLLDEPLSALDLVTRRAVRGELRRSLEGLTCATLFVTHQPGEALMFGERIAVLEQGRVTQYGSRGDFVRHPRSQYAAEFLGVNLLEGAAIARSAGVARMQVEGSEIVIPDPGSEGPVRVLIHPHDIVVSIEKPAGSSQNVLRGAIEEIVPEPPAGDRVRVLLSSRPALAAQVTPQAVAALGLRRGLEVFASFKATGVEVLPR